MLRYVLFDTTLFDGEDNRAQAERDLCWLLEALTQRNQHYLKMRPDTPRLYKSGVYWEAPKQFQGDPDEVAVLRRALGSVANRSDVAAVLGKVSQVLGGEHFCDIGRILELGSIDCDGLAAYRTAELRQAGIKARPFMTCRKRADGGTTYHALVLWPPFGNVNYETSEDPSLLLGMGGEDRAAERAEEIRKNKERCEILQKYGVGNGGGGDPGDQIVQDILGIRRRRKAELAPVIAEVERMLKVVR